MMVRRISRLNFLVEVLLVASLLLFWAIVPGQANQLQAIQERGRLIVAVKDDLRPLGFRDSQGNLQGLEIDLARRLAGAIVGNEGAIELRPVLNRDRLNWVTSHQVDLTIAQVTATIPRNRLVTFSVPYYADGTSLVSRQINRLQELGQGLVAVLPNSSAIAEIRHRFPGVSLLTVNSYADALAALEAGRAIAFAGDTTVLAGWVQTYPSYRLFANVGLYNYNLAVVMPKGLQHNSLHQQVNDTIRQSQDWLRERINFWGLPE